MLAAIALIGVGIVIGVVLASTLAFYVVGQIQAEAARAMESFGMLLFTQAPNVVPMGIEPTELPGSATGTIA